MGIIGRLLNHEIEKQIKVILETRAGFNQKATFYNPPGDASVPCKDDRIIIVKIDGTTGNYVALGVLVASQDAKPGEKIFFARDADGEIVSKISMLNNGDIKIKANEKIHLNENGKNAARKDDTVKVKIPAGTFIVSVSGSATGTPNPIDLEFEGKVTEGSESVLIGD